jgi:acetyl esterase/lipase
MSMKRGLMTIARSILMLLFINSCSKDATTPNERVPGTPPPTENVVYGTAKDWQGNSVSLDMNIYLPSNLQSGSKYPLVIYIHGGGFLTGDKKDGIDKCQLLADSGFVAVTVNYRLGWNSTGSQECTADTASLNTAMYRGMQDVNAALRYLVEHASDYNIDPNWVFLSGSSAGAVLAQICSYETDAYATERYPVAAAQLGSLFHADNTLNNTYAVRGICSMWGATEDSNLVNSTRAIPTIFFHGSDDNVVPPNVGTYMNCSNYPALYGSACLYRRLIANGVPAVLHIMPGEGHGVPNGSKYTDEFFISNTACFFHGLIQKTSIQTGIYVGLENSCQ